jgi:hypothetical protein
MMLVVATGLAGRARRRSDIPTFSQSHSKCYTRTPSLRHSDSFLSQKVSLHSASYHLNHQPHLRSHYIQTHPDVS